MNSYFSIRLGSVSVYTEENFLVKLPCREIDAMAGQFAFEIKLGFLIINIRK